MINDLSCAVLACAVEVDVTRFLPQEVTKGRVQGETPIRQFKAFVSMQPMTAKELKQLPEGERADGLFKGYTDADLKTNLTSECRRADQIEYRDVRYEIHTSNDWLDLGGYFKIILQRLDR